MEFAYPLFRGAGSSNDAVVLAPLLSFFFPFIFVIAKELVSWPRMEKRTSMCSTRGLLPHRVHYDRAKVHHLSFLPSSVYGFFFYDFSNVEAAVNSPRVDGNYGREPRCLAELRRQFYFLPTSIFEPFQFLEVSMVNALHIQGYYLADILGYLSKSTEVYFI